MPVDSILRRIECRTLVECAGCFGLASFHPERIVRCSDGLYRPFCGRCAGFAIRDEQFREGELHCKRLQLLKALRTVLHAKYRAAKLQRKREALNAGAASLDNDHARARFPSQAPTAGEAGSARESSPAPS